MRLGGIDIDTNSLVRFMIMATMIGMITKSMAPMGAPPPKAGASVKSTKTLLPKLPKRSSGGKISVTTRSGLESGMREEVLASKWYKDSAAKAREQGDDTTADLYDHIAREEDVHYSELLGRMEEIPKSGSSGKVGARSGK